MSQVDPIPITPPQAPEAARRQWPDADNDTRRRLIVDVAMDLLHQEGIDAVTIRRVAAILHVGAMTLYTYVEGQHGLRRAMVQRGFEMLCAHCAGNSTLACEGTWAGGARTYVQFGRENPNLYRLMFDHPLEPEDEDLLHAGFDSLLTHVKERLAEKGLSGRQLDKEARRQAGRYWLALHGLVTILNAGRAVVLEGSEEELLDDLLEHNAPE